MQRGISENMEFPEEMTGGGTPSDQRHEQICNPLLLALKQQKAGLELGAAAGESVGGGPPQLATHLSTTRSVAEI